MGATSHAQSSVKLPGNRINTHRTAKGNDMARSVYRRKSRWKICGRVFLAVALLLAVSIFVFFTFLNERSKDNIATSQRKIFESFVQTNFPSRKHSLCPNDRVIKSSAVNRLGTYPKEKRFLTIGIATVSRPGKEQYLLRAIQALTENITKDQQNQIFIVVFLADLNTTHKENTKMALSRTFNQLINEQRMVHVIEASLELHWYLPLGNLKRKYGDSEERVKWRSKQNLDYGFLMCYCKDLSQYYLHLEDDVIAAPSFYPKLCDFISSQSEMWPALDAGTLGHIGKVYHAEDLGNLASFFILFYDEMPVDWLMMFWRAIKLNVLEGNILDMEKYFLPAASLFQHIGDQSSLKEKGFVSNRDRELYFDIYDHKYKGLNPAARVSTSLSLHKGTPEDAYNKGSGYFWAKNLKKGDFILLTFSKALCIREVFVDTGSHLAPYDVLKSGVLQASFSSSFPSPVNPCGEFRTIGDFDKGKVRVVLADCKRFVTCLQVLITQPQEEWLFVREIDVWPNV